MENGNSESKALQPVRPQAPRIQLGEMRPPDFANELINRPNPIESCILWRPSPVAANCLPSVTLDPDVPVIITQEVLIKVEDHLRSGGAHEHAGFLLGNRYWDAGNKREYILIDQCVHASYTQHTPVSVIFTAETWGVIRRQLDTKFLGKAALGWYHSHPNLTVFLSDDDVSFHTRWFRDPFSVALVVDPINREGGVFTTAAEQFSIQQPLSFAEQFDPERMETRETVIQWRNYSSFDAETLKPVGPRYFRAEHESAVARPIIPSPGKVKGAIWRAAAGLAIVGCAGGYWIWQPRAAAPQQVELISQGPAEPGTHKEKPTSKKKAVGQQTAATEPTARGGAGGTERKKGIEATPPATVAAKTVGPDSAKPQVATQPRQEPPAISQPAAPTVAAQPVAPPPPRTPSAQQTPTSPPFQGSVDSGGSKKKLPEQEREQEPTPRTEVSSPRSIRDEQSVANDQVGAKSIPAAHAQTAGSGDAGGNGKGTNKNPLVWLGGGIKNAIVGGPKPSASTEPDTRSRKLIKAMASCTDHVKCLKANEKELKRLVAFILALGATGSKRLSEAATEVQGQLKSLKANSEIQNAELHDKCTRLLGELVQSRELVDRFNAGK